MKVLNKNNTKSLLNIRLTELMQEKRLSLSTLSQQAGIAIGTIQKLVSDPTCNPTIASLEAICNVLEVSVGYLVGHEEISSKVLGVNTPVLNWDTLRGDLLMLGNSKEVKMEEGCFVHTTCLVSEKAFALQVVGNSMLPLFPKGTFLVFDQEKIYYDGCYVLVDLSEIEKPLFKQLLVDEPNLYIKSINPIFGDSLTLLGGKDKIIATLVQSQIQY